MDDTQIWIDLGALMEALRQFKRSIKRLEQIVLNSRYGCFEKRDHVDVLLQSASSVFDLDKANLNTVRQQFLKDHPGRAEILIAAHLPELKHIFVDE